MEKAQPRELQGNGTIFLIIPGLKSSLPMGLLVKRANKFLCYLNQFELGFISPTPETIITYTCWSHPSEKE